ncbi:MAG: 4-phosphopantetheinyl transferase [Myxococcales bacterium]|nr:4-phosphopantetheinyl transferase [Myxococcales bacterium]
MILGIGVDLTPISRLERAFAAHPERLEKRLFTDGERSYCRARANAGQHFAARFAAKEALLKALHVPEGLRWHELEVVNDSDGAPTFRLSGNAAAAAAAQGVTRLHLSITHADDSAMAFVVAER